MADLHHCIELSGLSSESHLDERLKSLSLQRAKRAQTPYDIEESEYPGNQVGLWLHLIKTPNCMDDELSDEL